MCEDLEWLNLSTASFSHGLRQRAKLSPRASNQQPWIQIGARKTAEAISWDKLVFKLNGNVKTSVQPVKLLSMLVMVQSNQHTHTMHT